MGAYLKIGFGEEEEGKSKLRREERKQNKQRGSTASRNHSRINQCQRGKAFERRIARSWDARSTPDITANALV